MQPEMMQAGTAVVPDAPPESRWQTVDKIASYVFALTIFVGGICLPLGLAVYSLFFRD